MNLCFNVHDSPFQHSLWLLNKHKYMYDNWFDLSLRLVFQLNPNQWDSISHQFIHTSLDQSSNSNQTNEIRWVIKSSLSINQIIKNWIKAKINTQEVEVYRIKIGYIKPRHEGVQLLIEYYNAILVASTHKIYTKHISLVSQTLLYPIIIS